MAPPSTPPSSSPKKKSLLTFLVNFFHVFNAFLFLSGCCVLGVGIWIISYRQNYAILVKTVFYNLIPWVLVGIGIFIMVVAIVGSLTVRFGNRCILLMYIFSLLLILLLELTMGCLASVYMHKVEFDLSHNLPDIFKETYGKIKEHTRAIDDVQQTFKCCGANSFEEWLKIYRTHVPDSCCKTMSEGCGSSYHPSNIPYTGCIHALVKELRHLLSIVSAVTLGVSIIPIIGVILACWIYIKMKDHSRYNGYTPGNRNPM